MTSWFQLQSVVDLVFENILVSLEAMAGAVLLKTSLYHSMLSKVWMIADQECL